MYVASTLVGVASYATAAAATAIEYVPEVTAPVWRGASRGLTSVSMLLEALNTLAVSQMHSADEDAATVWALVMSAFPFFL
jgi:hypothetical protein